MGTYSVHLINTVSTTVTVEAETYDEAIDAAFDSNDMPGSITIGAFGQATVDDGEWEAVAVTDEESGDEVWSEYPQDELNRLRARVAELEGQREATGIEWGVHWRDDDVQSNRRVHGADGPAGPTEQPAELGAGQPHRARPVAGGGVVSAADDLLSDLRACVAAKQDAPYLRAPELALLVGHIDGLESELRNVTYDRDGAQAEVRRLAAANAPRCTCDYAGIEGERHKPWCEIEGGPHAECRDRIAELETERGTAREHLRQAYVAIQAIGEGARSGYIPRAWEGSH